MIQRSSLLLLYTLSLLALSGCVTREQADAKLARGCLAGAELFLDEGFKIGEIRETTYRDSPGLGKGYREVTIKALETDGWYEAEKAYQCIFMESFAIAGLSHTATLYQLRVNGQVYGKEGDQLLGSFGDHLKLTETVEQGMNRR